MAKRAESAVPAKRTGLVVQTIGDEVIVYDPDTHQAHSLNRPAALVFDTLDGKASVPEIASQVGRKLGARSGERVVRVALEVLGKAGLLSAPTNAGRRAVVRGLTVGLLPVVTTILVPKPAAAQSCVGFFQVCGGPTPAPCCSPYTCCFGLCRLPSTCTSG